MKIFRRIAVSLSLYSRIPMPVFTWTEEDSATSLMFFPLVGVLIGALELAAYQLLRYFELPAFAGAIVLLLIPVFLTGGFHLDGFMDTTDALRSYRDREEKLKILKDPHVGAFAVIGLASLLLTAAAAAGLLTEYGEYPIALTGALSFVLGRSVSGLLALYLPKARKDGMLKQETKGGGKGVSAALLIWGILAAAAAFLCDPLSALLLLLSYGACSVVYGFSMKKQFGGVTGDTAGYFLSVSECVSLLVLALWCVVRQQL